MQNSYIVDAFLSGALWATIIYLFFDIKDRISVIDQLMGINTFSVAMADVVRSATLIALPFIAAYLFLLWRFYGLMLASESWGYGGMGLLIIFVAIGLPMIWLQIMLILVKRGRFIDVVQKTAQLRESHAQSRGI